MSLTSEPYLVVRTLERQLILSDIDCPRRITPGTYRVCVGTVCGELYAVENRVTGGKPLRKMELHASGAMAVALVDMEAILRRGEGPLQLEDADGEVFAVTVTRVWNLLYLGGDFVSDRASEWFPCRITLSNTTTIHGFALDKVWRGGRVLALDEVGAADERALIQAVITLPTPLVVERIS